MEKERKGKRTKKRESTNTVNIGRKGWKSRSPQISISAPKSHLKTLEKMMRCHCLIHPQP